MDLTTIPTTTTSDATTRGPLGPLFHYHDLHLSACSALASPDQHIHQHRPLTFNFSDGSHDNHPSFTVLARPSNPALTHIPAFVPYLQSKYDVIPRCNDVALKISQSGNPEG
jgi:hypothetical protein